VYVCQGGSRFLIFAGVNRRTTEAVTYTITYADVDAAGNPIGPTTTVALGVLQPGQHVPNSTTIWQIPHGPGVPQRVQISGIGVTTGRSYVALNKVIPCDCPTTSTSSSTSTSSTSTTSSTTPTPPPTPTGRVSSIANTTTTEPVTLPPTGSSGSGPMAGASLALIAVGGLLLLLAVRTGPDSSDSDS
jgi:hypothetical protein